jgi:hypothetical protein
VSRRWRGRDRNRDVEDVQDLLREGDHFCGVFLRNLIGFPVPDLLLARMRTIVPDESNGVRPLADRLGDDIRSRDIVDPGASGRATLGRVFGVSIHCPRCHQRTVVSRAHSPQRRPQRRVPHFAAVVLSRPVNEGPGPKR